MKKHIIIILCCAMAHLSLAQDYYVYVTAESEDEVALIHFNSETATAEVAKVIPVGVKPADIEGPHGITVGPEGKYWYLSMAHGNPNGYLYKFETGTDNFVDYTTLGIFPASMQISPATGFLFCVNFNLHGEMVPSTVSVVEPNTMTEVTKVTVGTMPHGSRISSDGLRQYSVGMMSGELFEINTMTFQVSRILNLDKNEAIDPAAMGMDKMDHAAMGHTGHSNMSSMSHSAVKPTWVTPHPTKPLIYVAGNGSDEILEIDAEKWTIIGRMPTGKAPYNLDITPDGKKLIASYKGDGATGIWDLETHTELARIPNTRKVTHGVAVSPDNKYAFISVEGIGGEPGTMDIINLTTLEKDGSVNLGKQAGGIAFWKMVN